MAKHPIHQREAEDNRAAVSDALNRANTRCAALLGAIMGQGVRIHDVELSKQIKDALAERETQLRKLIELAVKS